MKDSLKIFDDGIRELDLKIDNLNIKISGLRSQIEGLQYARNMMETLKDNLINKDEENKN